MDNTTGTFSAIIKVNWLFDGEAAIDYIGVSEVSTYAEAAAKAESFFNSLEVQSLEIVLLEDPYINFTKEQFAALKEEAII